MIFLSLEECTFFADKAYDVKAIYNTLKNIYHGDCVIPLNKRSTKNLKKLSSGHPNAKPVLQCTRTAKSATGAGQGRNTAARSSIQNAETAHVTTKIGTMAKRIAAVPSM